MTSEQLTSKTISSLRFPLTVIVVMAHFNFANNNRGFGIHGVMYGKDQPDWFNWILNFFGTTLVEPGVPLFFMIAGYYFFYRKDFNFPIYKQKLKTRFHTLLIPYLLWNTLAILMVAIRFLPFFSDILPGMDKIQINLTWSGIFHTYFDNFHQEGIFIYPDSSPKTTVMPIDAPLWFVRELMAAVLLSPLLYWLIRKLKIYAILLWGIVAYVISPFVLFPSGGYIPMVLNTCLFFSWGAYYSINKLDIITEMRKLKIIPVIYVFFAIADTYMNGLCDFVHYASTPFGAVTDFIFMSYLLEKGIVKENRFLSESSFFVFAMHMVFMWELGKVVFVLFHLNNEPLVLLVFFFGNVTLTILICLATYTLLKRYFPSVCNLLSGGR